MADGEGAPAVGGKPAVLIIGGLGYTGRFLALHIHEHDLASEVRIVDKHLPELAMLAPEFKEACSKDRFIQADASKEQNFPKIFDRSSGAQFDYVFNCGGETRFGQDDEVYKARSYSLSVALGREAARRNITCFVELSSGMVYKPDSAPRKESDKLKPSTKMAKWKLAAEEELAKIEGLNLLVLRVPHVYGPYTSKFLGTALCMARVYQDLGKEMKWLWKEDLRTHTVHVEDLVSAMWTGADYLKSQPYKKGGFTFNIVDHSDTTQSLTASLIHSQFSIPTGFYGTIISTFARLNLDHVVDDVNEETMDPWADLQTSAGIKTTSPLTPFMEKELLKDTDLSLDGSEFERVTGFRYTHEKLTKEEVAEVVESYRRMGWWP